MMASAKIDAISAARSVGDITVGELSSMFFMTAPWNGDCHK